MYSSDVNTIKPSEEEVGKITKILKYRFSFTVIKKVLLKFSSFISIRYGVICFLCIYREEFVFKPIRSQFNIVVGYK